MIEQQNRSSGLICD